jgi:hypothetical protein
MAHVTHTYTQTYQLVSEKDKKHAQYRELLPSHEHIPMDELAEMPDHQIDKNKYLNERLQAEAEHVLKEVLNLDENGIQTQLDIAKKYNTPLITVLYRLYLKYHDIVWTGWFGDALFKEREQQNITVLQKLHLYPKDIYNDEDN